jgi:hypothetical protein
VRTIEAILFCRIVQLVVDRHYAAGLDGVVRQRIWSGYPRSAIRPAKEQCRMSDEIAAGTYDTPEKLDAAIDELLSDLQ